MEIWRHPDIVAAETEIAALATPLGGLEATRVAAAGDVPERLLEDLEIIQAAVGIAPRRRHDLARAIAAEVLHSAVSGFRR